MTVDIDKSAGFCAGVARAIALAERALAKGRVASIGPVIHNPAEVARLQQKGLVTVPQEEVESGDLKALRTRRVLIRSHGVSESLRARLAEAGLDVVDGTCPIVRHVQQLVKDYCARGYRVVVFGKREHPEVLGLVGHCPQGAVVVNSLEEADKIAPGPPTVLVAQTTAPEEHFHEVEAALRRRLPSLEVFNTTCRAVSRRQESIVAFAGARDVVVFVGGKESSNSRQLFTICQQSNKRSFWVESAEDVQAEWFSPGEAVGITGGASTPRWLLERVASHVAHVARTHGHEKHIKGGSAE
ncbi:MAG: 4-hydroxy-3-methylbut-2-enyl diphosphate reductase [bacterium]|nr:4-hydroxy-3-methylbut-2-enyl diphosphate reductase [candidate division KSB1 bacterium]MDH7558746.1 4-hydroxy-3-methylbut-2-enyl diphosphate reductase [bacterium]